jgi:hypothetical protein
MARSRIASISHLFGSFGTSSPGSPNRRHWAAPVLFALFFLFTGISTQAQCTLVQVTGTVTDPNNIPYAFGTVSVDLNPSPPGNPTCNGAGFNSHQGPVQLDSTGSFSLTIPQNAAISPSGTQWLFTISETPGVAPPLGFGPVSFQVSIAIAGTGSPLAQSVTTQLTAAALALTVPIGGGAGNPASPPNCVQLNKAGAFGTLTGFCFDSLTSPTLLTVPTGLTATGNGAVGNVAIKFPVGDSFRYVDSAGNDSNDGLSAGSAKLTVMAAYDSLPASGGTISICSSNGGFVNASSDSPPRIWIAGSADPNYSSLPTGWRQWKPVYFLGSCGNNAASQGSKPQVLIVSGSGTSTSQPAIWLSSLLGANITFENLQFHYPAIALQIGVDSTGAQTSSSGVVGVKFENVSTSLNQISGNGPGILLGGGNTFNIYIDNCQLGGNTAATVGSDQQAAILAKPASSSNATASFSLTNSIVSGGPVKYYQGTNGNGITISNLLSEDITGPSSGTGIATVWFTGGSFTQAVINTINTSDFTGSVYDFRLDGSVSDEESITLIGNFANGVKGPSSFGLGAGINFVGTSYGFTTDPLVQGMVGFNYGRVYGFDQSTQRAFGPSAVRWTNIASTLSSGWTATQFSGTTTITQGIIAPDGCTGAGTPATNCVTGAAQASNNSATSTPVEFLQFFNTTTSIAVGDWFIGGFWERSPSGLAFADIDGNNILRFTSSGDSATCSALPTPSTTDGEWIWVYAVCEITAAATSPGTVMFDAAFTGLTSIQAYAPTLIHIPAGAISTNEAYEIANNLNPYNSSCAVATVCGISGISGGGTGTVTISGTPATPQLAQFTTAGPSTVIGGISGVGGGTNPLFATWTSPANGQVAGIVGGVLVNTYQGIPVNSQTTSYTLSCPTDRFDEIDYTTTSSGVVLTVPQAGSSACLQSNVGWVIRNATTSTFILTVSNQTSGCSGTCSLFEPEASVSKTILPGAGLFIYSDAASAVGNYHALDVPSLFGTVNVQTSAYTLTAADRNKLVVMNCSSACAATLPAAPPDGKWTSFIMSIGSTLATVSLNSLTFNGAGTAPTLTTGHIIQIRTDATNYYGDISSSGGGTASFSGLTGGTNTTAAMVVGSGASLSASGGTIAATSVPLSGVSAGNAGSGNFNFGASTYMGVPFGSGGCATASPNNAQADIFADQLHLNLCFSPSTSNYFDVPVAYAAGSSVPSSSWTTGDVLEANFTGSLFQVQDTGKLFSTVVLNNQANTYAGGGLQDFSADTWKIPTSAGFTASSTSMLGEDSTANALHGLINSADAHIAGFASAPAGGKCAQTTGTLGLLVEASGACGSGGGSGSGVVVYSGIAPSIVGGTNIFTPFGGGSIANATEANVQTLYESAATVTNMGVSVSAAPGAGNSLVFTIRDNTTSTAVTCTISGASATSCSDVTHSFNTTAGHFYDVLVAPSGTFTAYTPDILITAQFGTTTTAGTVNTGTANQVGYYAAAGASISGVGPGTAGWPLKSGGSSAAPGFASDDQCIVTSSSDQISAAGAFASTCSIPNTNLAVGTVIEVFARGIYTTSSTATPVMMFEVNAGGTTSICPNVATAMGLSTNQTASYWDLQCKITIVTTGSSGTATAGGWMQEFNSTGAAQKNSVFNNGTTFPTYNTSASSESLSIQETATLVSGQTLNLQFLQVKVIP